MNRGRPEDRNRLSYWYPKLPSHISTPETTIIPYTGEDLINLLDGKIPEGFDILIADITQAGYKLGWPMFLRTDYLSGKHNWKNTCHIPASTDVSDHVFRLVEESAMADMMGFPTDCWVVRNLLPTLAAFIAFPGDMPIVKERRYFVRDATVVCHHPYWPREAFLRGNEPFNWEELLAAINVEDEDEVSLLSGLSSEVGGELGEEWSIDWLWSEKEGKWYLIDMAAAAQSYHWPGCPNAK
ncbi:MAG: hypothetical protein DRJ03_00870 [Chloroflexi bacterium]|nr:MAG: hypothetical protein DRJ03_00870 [Chloroflexota bacterium]